MKNHTYILILILTSFCTWLSAQSADSGQIGTDSLVFEAEKLYIHTDKDIYLPGETIWLKGYLANSSFLSKTPVSNFIYAELYSDTLLYRVKVRFSDLGFAGQIELRDDIVPGKYLLRAYTQNMQNYPEDEMFHKRLEVLSKNGQPVSGYNMQARTSGYDIDVQFLPESGRYIVNRPARIAFKAVGSDGKSANVSVVLYDSAGNNAGEYKTKHNGMGLINLISADSGGYYALVSDSSGFSRKVQLPKPETSGAIIAVSRIGDKVSISAFVTNDIKSPLLVVGNGSEELFRKPLGETNIVLPEGSLASGVSFVQIRNENDDIIAERLFYTGNPYRSEFEILHSKEQYDKRERVRLNIKLKDHSGKPVSGEFSISVTDRDLAPLFLNRQNIVSYMELMSELKGEIEDPGYYFNNPSAESARYLDLVMMIHGWRHHTESTGMFKREYTQEISGSVSGLFKKDAKNTTLMIFAPQINLQQAYYLNQKSTFTLEGLDFTDSTKFLLGVVGKGGGQLYGVSINKEIFPPLTVSANKFFSSKNTESVQNATNLNVAISVADQNRSLTEIVVEAQSKDFYRPKYNPSPFQQSFSRSQLREREELEMYDQVNLMDYLMITFPGLYISSNQEGERVLYSARGVTMNGPGSPLLYVDGLQWTSTALLDQYGWTVMDVENVAFLRGTSGSMFNTINGVILLTSRKNSPIQKSAATNTAKVMPLGYQKRVEFYAPKYETPAEKNSTFKDNRSTLYWNPCVRTDENGCATLTFYTGDRAPKLNISAEGVTCSGEFVAY
ncbi:MAG: hypothetical protein A2X18_02450 [Bacteroidetes bacterium GWF2_40_14]|nr:MAG: hypothetical protein A2X18_02450 [Bacteroidetes bacterium GWF2_40_14]